MPEILARLGKFGDSFRRLSRVLGRIMINAEDGLLNPFLAKELRVNIYAYDYIYQDMLILSTHN